MKNTDYTINLLGSIFSSEDSLGDFLDMMSEMDLELTGVRIA